MSDQVQAQEHGWLKIETDDDLPEPGKTVLALVKTADDDEYARIQAQYRDENHFKDWWEITYNGTLFTVYGQVIGWQELPGFPYWADPDVPF